MHRKKGCPLGESHTGLTLWEMRRRGGGMIFAYQQKDGSYIVRMYTPGMKKKKTKRGISFSAVKKMIRSCES